VEQLRIGLEASGLLWWHLACTLKDAPVLARFTPQVYALNPQPADLNLDLQVEFQRLRQEPILLRGESNRNIDRTRDVEGESQPCF